jgi:hypothetical protein
MDYEQLTLVDVENFKLLINNNFVPLGNKIPFQSIPTIKEKL